MRMKMKKLICVWRSQLRAAPGPLPVPPGGGPGSPGGAWLLGPWGGRRPPRMGSLARSPGHWPVSWLIVRASLPVHPGRMLSPSANEDRRGWGPNSSSLPTPPPHSASRCLPHQDGQEDGEPQDPPEGHVVVAGPAPAGQGWLLSGSPPAPHPPDGGDLISASGKGD